MGNLLQNLNHYKADSIGTPNNTLGEIFWYPKTTSNRIYAPQRIRH